MEFGKLGNQDIVPANYMIKTRLIGCVSFENTWFDVISSCLPRL